MSGLGRTKRGRRQSGQRPTPRILTPHRRAKPTYVLSCRFTMSFSADIQTDRAVGTHACAWCGSAIGDAAERLAGRIRCSNCRVANTDPWPTDAELSAAYARYRPDSGRFSGIGDAVLRRTRARLSLRLDAIAPPGAVLDVGAGDGTLLDALRERGRESLGLEREATRPDIRALEVGDVDGEWAAIVFWHSLEHLPRPGEAIDHAAFLLAPGGVLVIAVPNSDSLQARLFADRWLALDLPRHLVHLSSHTLIARLKGCSLEVERVSHWRGGQVVFGWLHGLVGSLPGHPDLYDAIRRPEARSRPRSKSERVATLAAGTLLAPLAIVASIVEIALGRSGTVYVEARRG
jgi:SAM-dependent methyltransferase